MEEALKLAVIAYDNDEVPVGAVVVLDNVIIGKGFNQSINKSNPTGHAEIIAINDASQTLKNYRLSNCEIYVTLEPCHMCAKAIVDARLKNLFFDSTEVFRGAIQSIDKFLDRPDLNHTVRYSGGYIAEESASLLQKFFRSRRN